MTKPALRFALITSLFFGVASVDVTPEGVGFTSALAAKKKKKKSSKKKEDKPADDKKSTPVPEEPKGEELRTTGPANIQREAFGEKEFENSAKAEKKRDETIKEIKDLLGKMKEGDSRRGELYFRLAEIYWAKSKFIYQKDYKNFDEAYTKWVDNGRGGKEPTLNAFTAESDTYKKEALKHYGVVLEKFPDYPRLDEVLYIMAFNQYEAGKSKEAIDNYSQLIRQYPKSEYVSDSYLALGEHYFKANDLTKATKAYGKAYDKGIEDKRRSVYNYARYKLAWCDYNAQEFGKALEKFKAVVTEENKAGDKEAKGIQLKREALNDMVLTFSHLDATKEAYDYLKKESSKEEAYRLSGKLAAVYKEQGKHALEVDTLRMLINLDPDNTQAPDYQSSIVLAYSNLGDRPAVRKEVTRLVELYRPGSSWWRKNEANPALVDRARTVAENRMRELVTDYHRYAQKFKKVEDYETAADIYSQYLQAFPDSENAYRLNFFYAELLWDIGRWREAAKQYDAVVARDGKGEYTRTCAYNAVLAWEKIVNKVPPPIFKDGKVVASGCSEADQKKGKCGQRADQIDKKKVNLESFEKGKKNAYEAKKIPEDEVALSAACDAYVNVVPQRDIDKDSKLKEELIVVKFKSAFIYQSYYHFDEAAKRFGELIDRWPDSEYARKGADQILDSYDARENYPALEKWSRDFAKKKQLMSDDKFAKLVNRFMEGATFKNIDALRAASVDNKDKAESKKMALEAATRFEAFIKEFSSSEFAPIALYNAQLLYAGENQLDNAIATATQLLKDYSKEIGTGDNLKNKLEETSILNLAAYYEKVADYPNAAANYVRFADKYKNHEKSPDAIYNAGIFYLGLGDTRAATNMFARYIKDFPKQKDVPDVYLRIAAVYEDQEDWKRASAMYGEFEKLHGKAARPEQVLSARYKTALSLQKAGRDKDMLEACNGIISNFKKLDAKLQKTEIGQLAGGYCAFQILEPEYQAYKSIQIEAKAGSSGRKAMQLVKQALDDKLKQRDAIAKKYLEVLNYGNGEWGIAGLSRASDALLDYVKTLRNAPDPPMLKDNFEALDLFRTELENIAFPVEEQGITALEQALAKAFELGIYSQYTIEIEDKLKAFKPAKFGRVYELSFYPSSSDGGAGKTAAR